MARPDTFRKPKSLGGAFGAAASGGVQTNGSSLDDAGTKPSYVSLRVTPQEKARLKRDAAGLSLSAYVRERLLEDEAKPRRTRGKFPVKDHQALAKVLRALGRTGVTQNLDVLSRAIADGAIGLSKGDHRALRQACADIAAIRRDLLIALGLKPGAQ